MVQAPQKTIVKEVTSITSTDGALDETSVDAAGDKINYEITVTNTGNMTLTNVTVEDSLISLSCSPADDPLSLAPGESVVCTGSYEVTQADIDTNGGGDGDIDNTASADSDETEPVDDSEEVSVDYEPEMTIVKSVSSITSTDGAVGETEVDYAGDVINYSILRHQHRERHVDQRDRDR